MITTTCIICSFMQNIMSYIHAEYIQHSQIWYNYGIMQNVCLLYGFMLSNAINAKRISSTPDSN